MNVIRQLLHVIQLTPFAKNDGETDRFCSVCFGGRNFFSLVESIGVFSCFLCVFLSVYGWFFLLLEVMFA